MSKKIVLTGASSGIGKATAEKLAQEGHQLALLARSIDKLNALSEKLPGDHIVLETDLCQAQDIENATNTILDAWGEIDVLINNAGVGYFAPMKDGELEHWMRTFDLNVKAVLHLIHIFLPHLLKNRGHIINLASVAAHEVFPDSVVYCASKHALHAITVGMRKEFRDKLKVTDISPGAVETSFIDQTTHSKKKEEMENYFVDVIRPEDVANEICHVLGQPNHLVINEIVLRPNR
ncbi:MAG TPA: SDR family oxidoreductase [Saprospiraceae bacterium]|nr:SDR family oxidoreductase [Saprospiraceae bacterium]